MPFPLVRASRSRRCAVAAAVALALVATACSGRAPAADQTPATPVLDPSGYRASIRWTAHGVPHISAEDAGSLGFGQGWAVAEDRICVLADQLVKVRAQRARRLQRVGSAWSRHRGVADAVARCP